MLTQASGYTESRVASRLIRVMAFSICSRLFIEEAIASPLLPAGPGDGSRQSLPYNETSKEVTVRPALCQEPGGSVPIERRIWEEVTVLHKLLNLGSRLSTKTHNLKGMTVEFYDQSSDDSC